MSDLPPTLPIHAEPPPQGNGWSRAELHVFSELRRLATEVSELRKDVQQLAADMSMTKTAFRQHSILFGLIGGTIASFIGGIVLAVVLK